MRINPVKGVTISDEDSENKRYPISIRMIDTKYNEEIYYAEMTALEANRIAIELFKISLTKLLGKRKIKKSCIKEIQPISM